MKRFNVISLGLLGLIFLAAGCTVRTYPVVKDRVDQDLSAEAGNKGYLLGQAPAGEAKDRKMTRTLRVVEVEIGSPVKLERRSKPLIDEGTAPAAESEAFQDTLGSAAESPAAESSENIENYTVQKGDTLQKISQKYFGTTKKWKKIYELNQDKLKAPDKIRPGQVIKIPVEKLKEPAENLK